MILLSPGQRIQIKHWFTPDPPGRLAGMHILKTGNGAILADQWPHPKVILADTAGSYALLGDPDALTTEDMGHYLQGSIYASDHFVPKLTAVFPDLKAREYANLCLSRDPADQPIQQGTIRPLDQDDTHYLWGLSPPSFWITKSWGGPAGLAASGHAWGVFIHDRLASVACSYYLGETHEDVGVTTEPEFRNTGLSSACTAALCIEIRSRGVQPIWNAALDNPASIRIAEKLGFDLVEHHSIYYC